jgi:hypothetical protein
MRLQLLVYALRTGVCAHRALLVYAPISLHTSAYGQHTSAYSQHALRPPRATSVCALKLTLRLLVYEA